jgi:hypothetical protein
MGVTNQLFNIEKLSEKLIKIFKAANQNELIYLF